MLYLILHNHYKHFWCRWLLGTPSVICIRAMWQITCEIAFIAAGADEAHSQEP
jgi:hypothetical protein